MKIFLLLILLLSVSSIFAQTQWIKSVDNPVIDIGESGSWDEYALITPSVIYHAGKYHMWYCGASTNISRTGIGYATSDDGISWTKYENNPVITADSSEGSWEYGKMINGPNVVHDGEIYHMWYTVQYLQSDWDAKIGHATSINGIEWQKDPNNPVLNNGEEGEWDQYFVGCPSVIIEDNIFKMWFWSFGGNGNDAIGFATSNDGSIWNKEENPILTASEEESALGPPSILREQDHYKLWYTAQSGSPYNRHIRYATSTDGREWIRSDQNPVLQKNLCNWYDFVYGFSVLHDEVNNKYNLWFGGVTGDFEEGKIGYAWSMDGNDLISNYSCDGNKFFYEANSNMLVNTEVVNSEQVIQVNALLKSLDGAIENSTELFDDGNHNDGNAADGIYGNYVTLGKEETEYYLYITAMNANDSTLVSRNNNTFFTTKGPIEYDHYEFESDIKSFEQGKRVAFKLYLRNGGNISTIENVDVKMIIPENSGIKETSTGSSVWGDIAPDEIKGNQGGRLAITIDDTCEIGEKQIILEISSHYIIWWFDTLSIEVVTDVENSRTNLPSDYALEQNYPNPFNPSTTIKYSIPMRVKSVKGMVREVTLKIFDILGKEVATLVNEAQKPGNYEVDFYPAADGLNLTSGIYFYRIQAGEFNDTKKMILMK